MTSRDDVRDRALAALDLEAFHRAGIDPGAVVDAVLAALDGTVEYGVQCADGGIDFEADHDKTSLDGACDEAVYLDGPILGRPLGKFCGPHRVVQRVVSVWRPVEDGEQ